MTSTGNHATPYVHAEAQRPTNYIQFGLVNTELQTASIAKKNFTSLPVKGVGRIGVGKELRFDFIFREVHVKELDKLFHIRMSNPYYIYRPDGFGLVKYLGWECYSYAVNGLNKIVEEANDKRRKLISVLQMNPFLPYSLKASSFLSANVLDILLRKVDQGFICLFPLIVLVGMVIVIVGTIGLIVDVLTCRLRDKPSDAEVEWIRSQLDNNPELDSSLIDEAVHDAVNLLMIDVAERFNKRCETWSGMENVVIQIGSSGKHQYEQDEFMIIFLHDQIVEVEGPRMLV
jgi:hypothetical protein